MYVGTLTFDLLLGDVRSLKEKRAVVRPIVAELLRRPEVAAAEIGYQELHRRSRIGVAVVSGTAARCAEVLADCERLVDRRPEIELLSVRQRFHNEDEEDG